VLDPALEASRFSSEAYFSARNPRSVLCLALVHQGELAGVLYLENTLTRDAFTPARLEVLRLLSGQAASALANARLYRNLEEAGRELERKEAQLAAFLEALPIGVFVINAKGESLYANTTAQQILGRGIAPGVKPGQLAEVYQVYRVGTNEL